MTKEMIREWLEKNNHSRQWLADKCGVTLKTVNNWLSSDRDVPSKATRFIETLVENDRTQAENVTSRLVLEFNQEEFQKISQAALKEKMTVTDWAKEKLKGLI